MLKIHASESASGAKSYFFEGLRHGDYYTEGQERVGVWWGKAADMLGVSGEVETKDFCRLVDNRHAASGEQLTLKTLTLRRPGYDLTFCPCKSVSVMALLGGDERLIDLVMQSVQATLTEVEASVYTRVRKDGKNTDRHTGNIAAALFPHLTARPEKGQLPDPFIHVHAYTINATMDPVEAVWKALQFGQTKAMGRYFEAFFHNDLARRVTEVGYTVRPKGDYWEIDGVPDSVIHRFSKRGGRVKQEAHDRNIDDPKERARLAARTRQRKAPEHTLDDLRAGWRAQLTPAEAKSLAAVRPSKSAILSASRAHAEREALGIVHSVAAGLFERSSTIQEHRFVEACLRKAPGRLNPEHYRDAMAHDGLVVRDLNGARWVTHQLVYKEERAVVNAVRRGKGQFRPVAPDLEPPATFTRDQQGAFKHILTSKDRFTLIEGLPGTGKTSLARTTTPVLQGALREMLSPVLGDKVVMIAPTTLASRQVLREDGFKEATTVASFLNDVTLQDRARHGWIWFDEAAQVGTRDARKLVELTEKLDARMVIVCDRGQNKSVGRGDFPGVLIEHAGVKSHRMEENIRQTGKLKEVAGAFTSGEVALGFGALKQNRMLRELPAADCYQMAAREYVARAREGRKVSGAAATHEEVGTLNEHIRAELKQSGRLKNTKSQVVYEDLRLTNEEKRDVNTYKPGQMVQFYQNTKGFQAGKRYTVVGADPFGTHTLVRGQGEVVEALPFKHSDRWVVYDKKELEVGVGETIRMTANARVHTLVSKAKSIIAEALDLSEQRVHKPTTELPNGSLQRVKQWLPNGDMLLEGNRVLRKDFGHFTYGYARTNHALQSLTLDNVVAVATKEHLAPVNRGNFTVVVTRPQKGLSVFTDSVEDLKKAASRVDRTPGALDVVDNGEDPAKRDATARKDRAMTDVYRDWNRQQQTKKKEKDHGFER